MSTSQFVETPWKASHTAYDRSPFNIRPAPEFATAETLVASLYRAVGFEKTPEGLVPVQGRDFDKASRRPNYSEQVGSEVTSETWRTVIHGVLESPKQPNQSSRRFLQMCPVVPDVALYSGSARLTANSWNPGLLIQRMIVFGSNSSSQARDLWGALFKALGVEGSDDIWARWLEKEFQIRRHREIQWGLRNLDLSVDLSDFDKQRLSIPAQKFVKDLGAVLSAKDSMTRRQWISLVESVLRLGCVTHVLWLCDVNTKIWSAIRNVIAGQSVPSLDDIAQTILNRNSPYLIFGSPAMASVRDQVARYLLARLGINWTLWQLSELKTGEFELAGSAGVEKLLRTVANQREILLKNGFVDSVARLGEQEASVVTCRRGIGSNIVEFARHVLGQRQAANETLRGYDQGFFLRKSGAYSSAPWIVSLGPVSVLAVVHACLRDAVGPRSVQRLCVHLAAYGLEVDRDDIASGELGRQLRMLGLVLDSPDAETGMLLLPPFSPSRSSK